MRPPPLAAVEEPAGNGHDLRLETTLSSERELDDAERSVPIGLSAEQYARRAAVNAYRAAENAAVTHELVGRLAAELGRLRDVCAHRCEVAKLGLEAHSRRGDPPYGRESFSDLDQVHTDGGTERALVTREWIEGHDAKLRAEVRAEFEAQMAAHDRATEAARNTALVHGARGVLRQALTALGIAALGAAGAAAWGWIIGLVRR